MRILLADDHAIVREGLTHMLRSLPEVLSVDEASNGTDALAKMKETDYDLSILDISMPGLSGIDILKYFKDIGLERRVLILSLHSQDQYAFRAYKLGAAGYVSKDCEYAELKGAVVKLLKGGKYIADTLAEKLLSDDIKNVSHQPHERLTEREFQVMLMLVKGLSLKQIADSAYISPRTVSSYRARILKKMKLSTNAAITTYALKHGLSV